MDTEKNKASEGGKVVPAVETAPKKSGGLLDKLTGFFGFGGEKSAGKGGGKAKEDPEKAKRRKRIQIIAAVVLIAIMLIIYFSTFIKTDTAKPKDTAGTVSAADYCEKTQKDMCEFLSRIKGAGKVTVLINFESSTELVIAYITNINTTTNVADGGKYIESSQNSQNPVILTQAGSQIPLILKEIYPKVKGVIVGAEGASDVSVKLALFDAVRTYFKLAANDVQVYATDKAR